MCSIWELTRAYRFDELRLIEIEDCVGQILRYQEEYARMQFVRGIVPTVRDTRRRKRKILHATEEYGEVLYQNVQYAVVRLNELADKKAMGKIIEVTDMVSKECITEFCARFAYDLAMGVMTRPIDPAPAVVVSIAA